MNLIEDKVQAALFLVSTEKWQLPFEAAGMVFFSVTDVCDSHFPS